MALPQAKQDTTDARLAALTLPAGGWSEAARKDALTRVQAMGLPGARDEYWKYTRPDTLNAVQAPACEPLDDADASIFAARDALRIVFVDGVFDADASDDLAMEGVEIARLADTADIHWAKDLYGVLETRGQSPVQRPFAALNTAFATDGLLIHVTGQAARPIHITYTHQGTESDAILHHVIKVDPNCQLTILESGPAAARFNNVLEADIAESGALHHIRAQGRDHARRAATHMFARLATESTFKSFTLTVNGVLTRNEAVIEFTGDDAAAHVAGACMGDGDFHHDDTVFVTHDAVNCESRQVFKKVLRNGAVGVFQGKILVKPGAQKTDGYQISQSLLLDDDSQFLAKPELEIYADDVACSHGSTSGAIDDDSLFYLRARGVPRGLAEDMMTIAFIAEAVNEIEDESIREELVAQVEAWLARRRA